MQDAAAGPIAVLRDSAEYLTTPAKLCQAEYGVHELLHLQPCQYFDSRLLSLSAIDQLSLTMYSTNLCRLCWQTCLAPASKAGSGVFTVTATAILIKEQAELDWHPSSSPSLCSKNNFQT